MTAVAAALSLASAAPAAAAVKAAAPAYSPWAALSAFASPSSSAALCGAAATSAQQGAAPGCVLPQIDAPPVVAAEPAVPVAAPVAAAAVGTGIGVLPLLLGLASLAGLGALILGGNGQGGDRIGGRPVSPG
jgi:hypothetical protein